MNWDPHLESAISDLEVENVEEKGASMAFKIPSFQGRKRVVVRTT